MLLFAQWPPHELVQAWSREANDLAQTIFALYVTVAVTAARRSDEGIARQMLEMSNAEKDDSPTSPRIRVFGSFRAC